MFRSSPESSPNEGELIPDFIGAIEDFANYVAARTQGRPLSEEQFADIQDEIDRLSRAASLKTEQLTGNDIGFILSSEFGPRTCPCPHCIELAKKLQTLLQKTS